MPSDDDPADLERFWTRLRGARRPPPPVPPPSPVPAFVYWEMIWVQLWTHHAGGYVPYRGVPGVGALSERFSVRAIRLDETRVRLNCVFPPAILSGTATGVYCWEQDDGRDPTTFAVLPAPVQVSVGMSVPVDLSFELQRLRVPLLFPGPVAMSREEHLALGLPLPAGVR